ncbi:MAG TPA: tyrosine-type recombinase/integrase [Bacteroidales bacterium]|nr:tyrosine-type recombinase/integrase [Bacteroidales bacterium]
MLKEKFIEYIRYEKRFSTHTITAYQHDLQQFAGFMQERYSQSDISIAGHSMIRSWLVDLLSKGITPRSVNRKLSTLKSFYRFCLRQGFIHENPMAKVISPKSSKGLPVFLEKEPMEKLFSRQGFSGGFEGTRDRMILILFYTTGMRLSELCELRINSLDLSKQTIKVTGKRNKERIIPAGGYLCDQLEIYIKERDKIFLKEQSDKSSDHLFITKKGKPVYQRLVYDLVHQYLSGVSSLEKLSPHVLRHTFATQMLNEGADLNAIKEILGHANLAATQVYTHNTIEKLKSVYNQSHPRA